VFLVRPLLLRVTHGSQYITRGRHDMKRFWKIWYWFNRPETLSEIHMMQARVYGFDFLVVKMCTMPKTDLRMLHDKGYIV
jgi:hypothetical protein